MKKIVLLGGSGFIGRKLAVELSHICHVVVLDLMTCDEFIKYPNIEFHYFNFTDPNQSMTQLQGVDVIVHLVSTIFPCDGTDQISLHIEENVLATIRLLEEIKHTSTEIVFISSGGTVYGDVPATSSQEGDALSALCSYSLMKIMIEESIKMYGYQNDMHYKIVRLSNPYGYNTNTDRMQGAIPIFISKILNGETITIWGDGENRRDYIFLDDAVDAIMRIIMAPPMKEIFNVGSGISFSTLEVIQCIVKNIGDYPPIDLVFTESRICDVKSNCLDVRKIKTALDWSAAHSLEEGIQKVIHQYKNRRLFN